MVSTDYIIYSILHYKNKQKKAKQTEKQKGTHKS